MSAGKYKEKQEEKMHFSADDQSAGESTCALHALLASPWRELVESQA